MTETIKSIFLVKNGFKFDEVFVSDGTSISQSELSEYLAGSDEKEEYQRLCRHVGADEIFVVEKGILNSYIKKSLETGIGLSELIVQGKESEEISHFLTGAQFSSDRADLSNRAPAETSSSGGINRLFRSLIQKEK